MRVQLLFGVEVSVEAAASQSRMPHDLVYCDFREAFSIKQPPRAVDNALASFVLMIRWIRHGISLGGYSCVIAIAEKMFLNIF